MLAKLSPEELHASEFAGEKIVATLTTAPGNGAPIGGLKVVTANGWFAARPSGTESVYKLYAESFLGEEHLRRIQKEARELIAQAFADARSGGSGDPPQAWTPAPQGITAAGAPRPAPPSANGPARAGGRD